ncbi:MAG: phenylacetate--CoA ligase family protein [Rubrivivax sp.]|nr:phenylacetate--CoA ligase family protein [Rubrivivax sp.]
MASLYASLTSGLIFPLQEWLKGHRSVALRRELERSQWWSGDQLQAHRVARLRDFLVRIGAEVPYYRDLFARLRFDPRSVDSLASLQALPLLDKATIRAHGEALKSGTAGPLTRYNTGGSSGEPLIFYMDRQRKSHDVAAKWRATRWWGVDIGDRELVVWGSPVELGAQDRLRRWRDALMRSHLLPAFEMSAANLDRFVVTIRRERPAMLFGYPSSLSLIAQHARRLGQRMDDLGIRVAFVTSERLYDEQRQLIAEVFGCPVANGYGARDAGFIAHECPAGGLHISAEDIVVETVRPDGRPAAPGEAGEIVVTHLCTPGFPFVRYRTGDVGVLDDGRCTCGRGLPLLRELQGRTTDFVVAADGTVMHGLALIYILRDLPGVERFKVTQQTRQLTRVELVPSATFDRALVPRIVEGFRRRLGAEVEVRVDLVVDIAAERSGKYRYIVSHALHAG